MRRPGFSLKSILGIIAALAAALVFVLAVTWPPAAQADSITVPGEPRYLTATPGDSQVTLSWYAPSSDGGSAITRYEYRYAMIPRPAIVLTPESLNLDEGDASGTSYTVKMATEPTEEVTVTITGHLGTDLTLDKTSLTFTTQTWSTAQTVTVTAGHDDDETDDAATLTHTAAGEDYDGKTADLAVKVVDDETVSLKLSEFFLTVGEGDATGQGYRVRLSDRPTEDVTVTITGQSGTDLILDNTTLTFTTQTWSTAQTVTVTAGGDDDRSDDVATLTHTASGGGYDSATASMEVTVADDDRQTDWTSAGTEFTATVTRLTNGQEYKFEVRAVNSEGPGNAASVQDVPFTRMIATFPSCWYCVILGRNYSLDEGENAEFILRRFSSDEALTVTLMVTEASDHGSIIAEEELGKRKVTFPQGWNYKSVWIPTIGDDTYDAHGDIHPSVTMWLLPGHGYAVPPLIMGSPSSPYAALTVTVRDDDFPSDVTVTSTAGRTTIEEGQSTTLTFTFTSTFKPHADAGTFTVNVTGEDTADYTITSSEITVPQSAFERVGYDSRLESSRSIPYTAKATVTFTAIDDGDGEEAEDFTVSLAKGDGAQESIVLPGDLNLTIAKSDLPEFRIRSPYSDDTVKTESDGQIAFEITRDAPSTSVQPLRIRVSQSGNMIDGHMRPSTRTINIGPEVTTRHIYVSLKNDNRYERHSTITATILDDPGFIVSPTHGSAQVEVQDDDFPRGVQLSVEADRTTLMEGESATLTFTFKTRPYQQPHADTGSFGIDVSGGSDDYSLSTTTISAPQSAFQASPGNQYYMATSTATFTALVDAVSESDEEFTISVSRGDGAQQTIGLPDDLTLTIAEVGGPGVPRSVTAEPSGTDAIDVSWEEPASDGGSVITGYSVQWKEASGSWDMPKDVSQTDTDAESTSYTITNLSPGVEYSVRVIANNSVGNGLPSAEGSASPNSPATGQPTISGKAQVGETLTASTTGITDADGLTNATYSYEWLRVSGGTDSDIENANSSTYTLTSDDEGNSIKVRVSFDDDRGNEETLTSAATGAVAPKPIPLTAQFLDTPSSHDGEESFSFELRFSEALKPDFSYLTLREHAFTVTGGEVTRTPRLEKGQNIRWTITVEPDGNDDVSIVLPETTNCDGQGAICTEDGRMLSAELSLTVAGPEVAEPPAAPQSLTAVSNSDGTITLTWEAPNDASVTGYRILRRIPSNNETTLRVYVQNTNSTSTTYTDTNAPTGAIYVYRVKAINSAGPGPQSNFDRIEHE